MCSFPILADSKTGSELLLSEFLRRFHGRDVSEIIIYLSCFTNARVEMLSPEQTPDFYGIIKLVGDVLSRG